MLRVILVDDEPLARQGMRQLLATFPEVGVVAEADSVGSALPLIRREKPDAMFLDIRMPGQTGFDLLCRLPKPPPVVFVTAYSQHAVEAFEVDAVDYLLKPVMPQRLAIAIQRLLGGESSYDKEDRICLRTPERTVVAKWEAIPWLKAEGDFTRVFVVNERPLLICQTLGSYEKILPSPPFVRLDRSVIVNLSAVLKMESPSRDEGRIYFEGLTEPLKVGRVAMGRLRDKLSARKPTHRSSVSDKC